jgi:predicted Zn finger-like uncharacterized protein
MGAEFCFNGRKNRRKRNKQLTITCNNCGTVFEVIETSVPIKDIETVICKRCGTVMCEKKKSSIITLREISGPTKQP